MLYFKAGWDRIEEVNVEKQTKSSVWIKGRMNRKVTDYEGYFDNYTDAEKFLIKKVQDKIDTDKRQLQYHEEELNNLILKLGNIRPL